MKKKWFKGIATAIALTMTLTACGSPSATPDNCEIKFFDRRKISGTH